MEFLSPSTNKLHDSVECALVGLTHSWTSNDLPTQTEAGPSFCLPFSTFHLVPCRCLLPALEDSIPHHLTLPLCAVTCHHQGELNHFASISFLVVFPQPLLQFPFPSFPAPALLVSLQFSLHFPLSLPANLDTAEELQKKKEEEATCQDLLEDARETAKKIEEKQAELE